MHYQPIIITYAIYFLIISAVGFVASRVTRNLSDYILGGRHLSGPIAALGAGASDMSGWLLLGLPGLIYVAGLGEIWMPVGLAVGAYLNWIFVAKRLRVYTEISNNSLTIPAYFDNRFRDESGILRTVTACVVLLFFLFYASSGFVGCAVLFQTTFHMPYTQALLISATFLVLYTCVGGFLAVSWVDFLQGTLMLFALLLVPIIAVYELGGWQEFHTALVQFPTFEKITQLFSNSNIHILSLLAWGMGYFGQPHILVRFMAARSMNVLPLARRICMGWMILSLIGAIATGFIGILFFSNAPLADPETVFISLVESLFHPWLIGILLAAVLSAIMSTIAAQLLASSSALTEDIYHKFFRRRAKSRELLLISRLSVLLIAAVAIYLASNPDSSILNLVSYAWAGLGASFGPVILFSLYWRRMTRNGAVAGIVAGAFGVIVWNLLSKLGGIFTFYEIVPGFILGSLAIVLVSLLDKKPSEVLLHEFDKVSRTLKKGPN